VTPDRRRLLKRGAQLVVLVVVAWFVGRVLRGQWGEFRKVSGSLRPSWTLLAASGAIVLATYWVQVQVWRRLVAEGGVRVPFWRAARIWCISNLGKYVTGKVWGIAAMGALAQREGVAPTTAAAAAILNQLVNLGAGLVVVAVCGARTIPLMWPGGGALVGVLVAVGVAGLLLLPVVLPWAVRFVARRTGRGGDLAIGPGAIWVAIAANVVVWMLQGLAFHVLALALGAGWSRDWLASIAVFTGSYVLGYLAVIVPGGLGVREVAMGAAFSGLHLATPVQVTVAAIGSRLWLTVLEILPGALFLARDAAASRPQKSTP
jgi:glycosyltransferase 2 family protein